MPFSRRRLSLQAQVLVSHSLLPPNSALMAVFASQRGIDVGLLEELPSGQDHFLHRPTQYALDIGMGHSFELRGNLAVVRLEISSNAGQLQ